MDCTDLAVALLDTLPANRTLGLTVGFAVDGVGAAVLPVAEPVHNIIGSLHSSGIIALADAAALAAVLSAAPDERTARRIQPLGVGAQLDFRSPVRGTARATCRLGDDAVASLDDLFAGRVSRVRLRTDTSVDGDDAPGAAAGRFEWSVRLG